MKKLKENKIFQEIKRLAAELNSKLNELYSYRELDDSAETSWDLLRFLDIAQERSNKTRDITNDQILQLLKSGNPHWRCALEVGHYFGKSDKTGHNWATRRLNILVKAGFVNKSGGEYAISPRAVRILNGKPVKKGLSQTRRSHEENNG